MTRKRSFPVPAGVLLALVAAAALFIVPVGRSAGDPVDCSAVDPVSNEAAACLADAQPVPSLDPAWSASFVPPPAPRVRSALLCRPVNAVFYAQTDWLRLAQLLRENPSPCAEYYVSIPPLVEPKTQPRPLQAALIHELGPQFHVIFEFNFDGWRQWVDGGNGSWYQAGVEWRRRINAAGFDAAGGDIWGLNETGNATRTGSGTQRANVQAAMRGLYDGDGGPPVKGLVWAIGVSQSTADPTTYKVQLKNWFADSAFWSDVSSYVQFWSQEVYGDVRRWATPGADLSTRRDSLIDYLEHVDILADHAPTPLEATRDTIHTTDAPAGNAAWAWQSAYGYTWVDYAIMKPYVASQVYAYRNRQAQVPWRDGDSFGFAWAPVVSQSHPLPPWVPPDDFDRQTAEIVRQLAASIHASDSATDPPGIGACGPDGAWCAADIPGATFYPGWHWFWTWTQPQAPDSDVAVVEDTPTGVELRASDADADPLTYELVTPPLHGTLEGDAALRTYSPAPNFNGTDSLRFRVSDGVMNSRTATVRITVTPVNDAPVVDLASVGPIDEGAAPVAMTAQASDVEGDPLTYTWATTAGTVLPAGSAATLAVDDGPAVAHVSVTADDGHSGTGSAAVDVVVRNVAPTAEAGADTTALWRLPTTLTGSASDPSAADAAGITASWDFGDGSPPAADFVASHAYSEPGTYTATLAVTDKDGAATGDSVRVMVGPRPARVYYAGPWTAGAPWATLYARIWDTADRTTARLAGHRLTIRLGSRSCSAVTNGGGLAFCAVNVSDFPVGRTDATVTFGGDELYTAASVSSVVWLE